jgi:beta-lactam-binding protein with PASTA domain
MDVEGLTAARAVSKLRKAAHFKPTTQEQSSKTVAPGRVIATDPSAGNEVQVGSAVTVLVSSGPAPVHVPDVTVGQTLEAAEAALTNGELEVGTVTKQVSARRRRAPCSRSRPPPATSLRAGGRST